MCVEEGEDRLPQLRRVAMRREVLDEIKVLRHAERVVLMTDAMRHIAITRRPPQHIFTARCDQECTRCDERANVRPAPAVVIDPERAVAVAIGRAIHQARAAALVTTRLADDEPADAPAPDPT